MSSLLKLIKEKRNELDALEKQYLQETPACCNKKCVCYRENSTGGCSWSNLLEECRDYKTEDTDDKN